MKNRIEIIAALLAFLILVSCADDEAYDDELPSLDSVMVGAEVSYYPGMYDILASGTFVVLGTDSPDAPVKERHRLKTSFDYDFSIGYHEVTCDEFNHVSKAAGLKLELACPEPGFPASDMTFYDAVLFANAKSVAMGIDTAYSYSAATFDASGHCMNLEGFVFMPESEGMRLPTEAEWMLVANMGWNTEFSWNSLNSNYKKHEVCSMPTNSLGVCDMAGNVMEWVNDWLAVFKDTSVVDYVGAPDAGSIGERVVKGGSFRNASTSMNMYSRGDVYTVTSATHADYIGFRLACGKIPNPLWLQQDGKTSLSRVVPLAGSSNLRRRTGTTKMKLVFRNDASGNIAFIDYSGGSPSVVEIEDTLDAYHPVISPDGKKVAFCTRFEGVSGKSRLYVRNLEADGGNLVKLDVESAVIPRWLVRGAGDTVIVYVSDAGNNSDAASFAQKSTWQVSFANGKFGTPVKLFDGAYHGGVSADEKFAVTGSTLLRARIDGRDTVWYGGEQACNASLADDSTRHTLFLDFGSKVGAAFVGKSYGTHERLLVVDSTGKLINSVAAPAGYSFDHTEWVPGGNGLAVATLANADGAHTRIVLVDLTDSAVVELAKGDELWHPGMWIKPVVDYSNATLDRDSAGVYMRDGDDWGTALMAYNMKLLWEYRDSVKVAIVGSSRPLFSLQPSMMDKDLFVVNFAQTPNSIYTSRDLLGFYLLPHLKNLKYVIVSLDIDFWYKTDGVDGDNLFLNTYRDYPGYAYDRNHDYWQTGYPQGLFEYTRDNIEVEGYLQYDFDRGAVVSPHCGGWNEPAEIEIDSTDVDGFMERYKYSVDALVQIIQMAEERNVMVIGMIFPLNPGYKETGAFGRYGMRRSNAIRLIEEFEKLQDVYSNFKFVDENRMGNHDYSRGMFIDDDHLCDVGAVRMTARVDSLLRSMEAK